MLKGKNTFYYIKTTVTGGLFPSLKHQIRRIGFILPQVSGEKLNKPGMKPPDLEAAFSSKSHTFPYN